MAFLSFPGDMDRAKRAPRTFIRSGRLIAPRFCSLLPFFDQEAPPQSLTVARREGQRTFLNQARVASNFPLWIALTRSLAGITTAGIGARPSRLDAPAKGRLPRRKRAPALAGGTVARCPERDLAGAIGERQGRVEAGLSHMPKVLTRKPLPTRGRDWNRVHMQSPRTQLTPR